MPSHLRATVFAACALTGAVASASPSSDLKAALDDAATWSFDQEPVMATVFSVPGYDDKLPHVTPAARAQAASRGEALVARLRAIPAGLTPREAEWRDTAIWLLDDAIAQLKSDLDQLPWNHFGGSHQLARVAMMQPMSTAGDVFAWNHRLGELPRLFDEEIANARRGLASGMVLPKWAAELLLTQVKGLTTQEALRKVFLGSFEKAGDKVDPRERDKVRSALERTVEEKLLPAYQKLARFLETEYLPKARATDGYWALPKGAALYAMAVHDMTTTTMKPAEIHELGLREVARLEAEMAAVAKKQGHASLEAYHKALEASPAQHPKDAAALLAAYKRYSDGYKPLMAKQFGRLPKAGLTVEPIEAFREATASAAEYMPGASDGSRPGHTMVNTYKAATRSLWDVEGTAYHEGAPGHHLQLMLTKEDGEAPLFLRATILGAYTEGWALYAESLPKELGAYADPASDFGRLDNERLRAVRLVLDTGLHFKKWTRQQALDYMRAHTAFADVDARAEVDRYVVWPGQALGYKIGQLRIRAARARAEAKLGKRFDVRGFHDAVLAGGPCPMDILDQRVDRWVAGELAKEPRRATVAP